MSVHSDLGHRPQCFSWFNLKELSKDKQLRARMLRDDPESADPLRGATFEFNAFDAPIGVVVKQSSSEQNHPVVHSYQISRQSAFGPLEPGADYVGLVLYCKDGAVDWRLNGVHCKSGYINYKKMSDIDCYESDYGQVHGKLYASLFGEKPSDDVVASCFAIKQGLKWRFNSGTFNSWQKQLHMGRSQQKIVKAAIKRFASRHQRSDGHDVLPIAKDPSETESLLDSATMITEQMDQLLIHEGRNVSRAKGAGRSSTSGRTYTTLRKATVRISARWKWNTKKHFACLCTCLVPYRMDRNSITIHISWRRGGKQKSITMRKSLHCMCYQLLLDFQALTGKKASEYILLHHGMELPLRESLCNAGVCDGDVLTLQRAQASPRPSVVLPSTDCAASGVRSQRQLKHRGLPTVAE